MDRLKELFQLHTDLWLLHKKYYHLPSSGTDQEWDQLIVDYQALEKKYKQDPELSQICYQLVKAVVETIDTRYYTRKEGK